jgi:dienelactone hydrolase
MHVEDITYEVDGIAMVGHLAYDDYKKGPRPAVLLSHEGPGLDPHVKGRAERLAGLGYCAFALDYHGGGEVIADMEQMMARLGVLMNDPMATRARGLAGLDVLLDQPVADADRVACIGYCFGGTMSLEIARSGADVKAIVGFHPGLTTSPDSKHIKGSVLMCVGTDDPFLPLDARLAFEQDMRDAGVADWRIDVYGGVGHSFTNKDVDLMGMPGLAYHEPSDTRSWRSMLALFAETIDA